MLELERFKMIRLAEKLGIRHPYVVAQSRKLDRYILAAQKQRGGGHWQYIGRYI